MNTTLYLRSACAAAAALLLISVPGCHSADPSDDAAVPASEIYTDTGTTDSISSSFLKVPDRDATSLNPVVSKPEPVVLPDGLFTDVSIGSWYAAYITELYGLEIIPAMERFCPDEACTRGDFVSWIYNLYISVTGSEDYNKPYSAAFSDVPEDSEYYTAVMWAKDREIVNGVTETEFSPDTPLSREMSCTLLVRLLGSMEKDLDKVSDASLFDDTDSISKYAQSSVTASQMSGLVSGYEDNTFKPSNAVRRSEAAALIERTYNALTTDNESSETVSCIDGAYTELYTSLVEKRDAEIAAQKAAEEAARLAAEEAARKAEEAAREAAIAELSESWYNDSAFIGDSVSLQLKYYSAATGALGDATFLTSGSLSATNALWSVSDESVHPTYNGKKMRLEDSVSACGKKYVFIMLGINNVSFGVDKASADMVTMIDLILDKSPDVSIIIEAATPMTSTSTLRGITNAKIDDYNAKMRELASEHGWYYIDTASIFKGADGCLERSYCSDPDNMGIHFTNKAAELWVGFLKDNVPEMLYNGI